MNLFDIGVLVIVGFCLIRGGFRGLIREVSGIIGIVAAFYGANTYYLMLVPFAARWIESPGIQKMLCFFLLFCPARLPLCRLLPLLSSRLRLSPHASVHPPHLTSPRAARVGVERRSWGAL